MIKDFLGSPIEPGDLIVYPNRQGSSMWMNQARVIETAYEYSPVNRNKFPVILARRPNGKKVTITQVQRVVVVPDVPMDVEYDVLPDVSEMKVAWPIRFLRGLRDFLKNPPMVY